MKEPGGASRAEPTGVKDQVPKLMTCCGFLGWGYQAAQCLYLLWTEALPVPLQADFSARESSYHFCQLPLTHQAPFPSHSSSKAPCQSGLHITLKGMPPGVGVNPGQNAACRKPQPRFRILQNTKPKQKAAVAGRGWTVLNQYKMIETARLSSETAESTHESPTVTSRLAND